MIAIEESLKAARRELEEAEVKRSAALQELEEVKQAAGAEPVVETEKGLTGSMAAALAAKNIVGADAEALIAEVLPMYQHAKTGCGKPTVACSAPGVGVGSQQMGASQASHAAAPPVRVEGKGRPVGLEFPELYRFPRGRSLPRDVPVPRESSASRSPRGTREDVDVLNAVVLSQNGYGAVLPESQIALGT